MSAREVKNCLLCGVGGQGTVLASRIIAAAAMAKGLHAKTAETIGMAQRGGSVVSHVRIGEEIASPMIPYGTADSLNKRRFISQKSFLISIQNSYKRHFRQIQTFP